MDGSYEKKQEELKRLFSSVDGLEEKYQLILDLGKKQPHLSDEEKTEDTRVFGCQSITYLKTRCIDNRLYFDFESDALISAGLGQLLSLVYNGETAQVVLTIPPKYLQDLGIQQNLTPGRSQGLASMYAKMREEAVKTLK
jgi:cysteine desulfuration protein SufE